MQGLVKYLPEFAPGKLMTQQLVDWDTSEGIEKRKMVTKPFENPPKVTLRLLLDHTYGVRLRCRDVADSAVRLLVRRCAHCPSRASSAASGR